MNSPSDYVPPVVELSPDHQRLCQHTLRFIQDMGPLLQKVQACKVDCSKYEALREYLREINQNIVANFCKPNHIQG